MLCRAPIGSSAESATPDWSRQLASQHQFENLLSWLDCFWISIYWKRVKSMQNWRKNFDGYKKKIFQKCQNSQIFAIFWDRAILVEYIWLHFISNCTCFYATKIMNHPKRFYIKLKMNFLTKEKGLRRTICGHHGNSGLEGSIVRFEYRPWRPNKGSSSCLPKEARIEYERQEKSVAGNLPNFLKFHGLEYTDRLRPLVRPSLSVLSLPVVRIFWDFW